MPPEGPVTLSVHSMPMPLAPIASDAPRRARWQMWLVLLVCAAPVIASYFSFYVLDLRGSAYSELITPTRDLPADLPLRTLAGEPVRAESLKGQWLLTYVPDAGASCADACERMLFMQRQLRQMLGKDRDRLDKLVLLPDELVLTPAQLDALTQQGVPVTLLRAPAAALQAWLMPAPGHRMGEHLFLIDPLGRWMMRSPAQPDPARFKKDLERLMRANAGWDRPGR
ncbi:SCO family protein [Roseateles amylovorans]|uniref:Transmembrane protein n=1 Tax=Roseateles amylovorans TaxID=2978473 RepID=A0ABY6AYB3_9BURK|nr:hypothetical protein [Roseateles amylovorans]UXH77672.1 hypothetical protein N4261_22230 [Roseateles amylovorans]